MSGGLQAGKSLRIVNARLVDFAGAKGDSLLVRGGRIAQIGGNSPADETLDAGGLALLPAFIDLHTHLRDPGQTQKEDMDSGMRAALKGGYAHLCAMANTMSVVETAAQVQRNQQKAETLRLCRLTQAAAAGLGLGSETPTDWEALSKATNLLSNDGKTIEDEGFMRALLEASRALGFVVSTHCQPERATVARDLRLLAAVGGNLHIGHISHRNTVEQVREAKQSSLIFTCEATPHHLFGFDCDYRVNPPLRSRADAEALADGLCDGTVDCLATDHAPHTPQDKLNGMAGISNIEYAARVYWRVLHGRGLALSDFSRLASRNPALRLGLESGALCEGFPADLVLFDPDTPSAIDREAMVSRSHNTPFDGRETLGHVKLTLVDGEIRYDGRRDSI